MMAGLTTYPAVKFEEPEDYLQFEETLKTVKPTALVIIDDLFAMRIMQLATMYGYKVPENLSVISFNNSIFSTLTHPYITSIDVDVARLGKLATQKLMDQLNNRLTAGVKVIVPHQLILRETVIENEMTV